MLVYQLPGAFRRLPRPSSPVIAKASITCTLSLDPITVDPVLQNPPLRACLRQLRRAPFVSRREARYNSTLRIQSLISSKCALPSRIVKEQRTAFSSGFAQNPELNAVVNAIDRSRQHGLSIRPPVESSPRVMPLADTCYPVLRSLLLVELIGIEPTTPCLQSRCSPS